MLMKRQTFELGNNIDKLYSNLKFNRMQHQHVFIVIKLIPSLFQLHEDDRNL